VTATAENPAPRAPRRIVEIKVGPRPPERPDGERGARPRLVARRRRLPERSGWLSLVTETGFRWAMLGCSLAILGILVLFFEQLWVHSRLSLHKFGFAFFTGSDWDPIRGEFGALPFIYGTLVSSFLALVLAVPLAVGVAIFVTELCPRWLRTAISFTVELLAAIPSVIYGLWAFLVLCPLLRKYLQPWLAKSLGWTGLFSGPPFGIGMLAAGIVLAIMIIPIISSITREVLVAVPQHQREAVYALGATRWEMIRMAVLRNARVGILGAIILGLGRALGETMAVTMVIGNTPQISKSLFAPGYTMAAVIANEFSEATSDLHLSALVEIGLVLLLVTAAVNICARLLMWSITRDTPRSHG